MTMRIAAASAPGRAYPNPHDGDRYRTLTIPVCVPVGDDGSHPSASAIVAAVQRGLDQLRPTLVTDAPDAQGQAGIDGGVVLLLPAAEEPSWVQPGPVLLLADGQAVSA